jgi:hypothetical protein
MSDFTLEISENTYTIEVETSTEDNTENLEITTSQTDVLEIVTGFTTTVTYASDIVGLDNYLSNFIDSYNIDCGSP